MSAYIMQARENYNPANAPLVSGGFINVPPYNLFSTTDNQVVGAAYDRARGKIMYLGFAGATVDGSNGDFYNTTTFTLWDGYYSYPPGTLLNVYNNLSPYVAEKDVNNDAVVWYPTYSPANLVPSAISPGDATTVYTITITDPGYGYTSGATISFSGGGGSGAAATATIGTYTAQTGFNTNTEVLFTQYCAVTPSGQVFLPSEDVTQSAYPYSADGGILFTDVNGNVFTDIGPVSYTILLTTVNFGVAPTVVLTDFGVATGGVTYSQSFYSGSEICLTTVSQVFSDAVIEITITDNGSGYTSPPTVIITGAGASAAATAFTDVGITTPGNWRRIGRDYVVYGGGNNPVVVNPRNSDVFVHSESCEMYQYRYSDNFTQVISPYIYLNNTNPSLTAQVLTFGLDETWTYNMVMGSGVSPDVYLAIIPAAITSDEIAYDRKLAYAVYKTTPFYADLGVRTLIGTDGNVYCLSIYPGAGDILTYRLTQFEPPPFSSYISGDNIAGGTFTDVTPWTSSTGPNLDGENYVTTDQPAPSWFSYMSFFRLPASDNEAVAICKFFQGQSSAGSPTYTNTILSCVNLKLGASPSFDYHSAFVTGYMSAAWAPTILADAAYAVLNYRELDVYLEQTDVQYPGQDYSKRWLYFDVRPVTGGVVNTSPFNIQVVMVQYQFAYGSTPTVLQVIQEDGWNAAYPNYELIIPNSNYVVEGSLWKDFAAGSGAGGYVGILRDAGLTLGTDASPVWWWSGLVDDGNDAASNNLFLLNTGFTPREQYNPPTVSVFLIVAPVEPPFLRLAYSSSTPPPPVPPPVPPCPPLPIIQPEGVSTTQAYMF